MPSGSAVGSFLLVTLAMDNEGTNRANTTSGPAGWTHLGQIANSTNNVNLDVWYKFRASGDPSAFKWSVGPDPQDIVGGIVALSGVSSTTPLDQWVNAAAANGSTTSASVPGFTTVGSNEQLVFFSVDNYNKLVSGVTSGFSQQWNLIAGEYASGGAFTKVQAAKGATGAVGETVSTGSDWAIALIGLRPGS
jgi:hypothetical protein